MDILIGLLIIAAGAFCQSSSYVPINKIKQWSWESYWIVQGAFAWLLLPLLGAFLAVPEGHCICELITGQNSFNIGMTILFGVLWGVGGLTFGLSMRYLGVALGQSIALGTCAGLGTIMGPVLLNIFFPEQNALASLTASVLIGVAVTLLGIAIIGVAGSMKAAMLSEEEKRAAVKDFNFTRGLAIALLAGFMSGCFNVGLEFGKGINFGDHARHLQDPASHLPGDSGRLRHERHLLFLPEHKEPHVVRLCQGQRVGQQSVLLSAGRRAVVQPVLRPLAGQGLPLCIAHAYHSLLLYIDGAQRYVQQRMGHHPQGVEGLLAQDHRCAHPRTGSAHPEQFPAAAHLTGSLYSRMRMAY